MPRTAWKVAGALGIAAVLIGCSGAGSDGDQAAVTTGAGTEIDIWCAHAQAVEDQSLHLESVDPSDAGAVEAAVNALLAAQDDALGVVPFEIEADMARVYDATSQLAQLLARHDYDFDAVSEDADFEALTTDPNLVDASARLIAFNEEECGITSS
jgi:hypothetical protein